ncbi:5-oxoprolinase [Hysterangium stoloniferum]|nr:5-oxoprolinase [Hysterangium stoloniferum]
MATRLGVDVGGTFTDLLLLTPSGDCHRTKVPSTPNDQSIAVKDGIEKLQKQLDSQGINSEFDVLNHGTTVATNAILEGKGARVGLLVTEGYKDVLQIRRCQVPGGLAGWIVWPKPEPLASLEMTIEVPGRIDTHGRELRPLDERVLRKNIQTLKRYSPEAITICLINSISNPVHEILAKDIVREEFPDVPISISCEVLPELMEYERTITTVADAYVKPHMSKYLNTLQDHIGRNVSLRVLRSDGGLSTVKVASASPVNTLMSGPSGGVAGVVSIVANRTEFKDLVCCDMGGTSTDVSLIHNGVPKIRRETHVGDLVVKSPSVDVHTVGAGGGSIAHVPEITKSLRVGPKSAGAVPGPACYSRGGVEPTVTDANAVLGYLPKELLGGSFPLDIEAARTAIQTIADALHISIMDAAEGIIRIANENILGALRLVSVEAGYDPRDFALVVFGGAGPLHGCALGKLLHCKVVIVPPSPGVLCAFGAATTGLRHELSSTFIRRIATVSLSEVLKTFEGDNQAATLLCTLQIISFPLSSGLAESVCDVLEKQGVPISSQVLTYEADLRYGGQSLLLPVPLDLSCLSSRGLDYLAERFTESHKQLFTFDLDLPVEFVHVRVKSEERHAYSAVPQLRKGTGTPDRSAIKGSTSMHLGGKDYFEVEIWNRSGLKAGDHLAGPCIITEMDSNTLVHPDYRAEVDSIGNILLWPIDNKETGTPTKNALEVNNPLDPITVDIIESALSSARNEMDVLMTRCSMSPGFVPDFLQNWTGTIEEGDIFMTNDPYSVSGAISHLNDILILVPVFCEGELIAWTANFGHVSDIAGAVPGSLGVHNKDIFADGLQIPPVKIYQRGVLNEGILQICYRNTRLPHYLRTDVHALMAACNTAGARMIDLYKRFGKAVYDQCFDALLERNKRAVGNLIKTEIPPEGCYFEDYIDDDGEGCGPWKMYKQDDSNGITKLHFDFTGTDPQAETSINFLLSSAMWKMFVIVFDPSIVVNDGAHELIEVHIPKGCLLNPTRPAPLSCRTHALGRVLDVLAALFGMRNPAFLCAAGFSDSPHVYYSGRNDEGEYFLLYQISTGGIPARPIGDGPDGHSLWPSMQSVPCEYLELYFPLIIERYELVEDSGGPGFYRGGNGIRMHYRFLAPGEISLHDDRWLTKPWGVNGGEPGKARGFLRSRRVLIKRSGEHITYGAKAYGIRVEPDDVLIWETWGGGGKGDPLERDPALVALEVDRRLVSVEGARQSYGVERQHDTDPTWKQTVDINNNLNSKGRESQTDIAFATDTRRPFVVDNERTAVLRAQLRARRTRNGGTAREVFNRGGSVQELLDKCMEETGLEAPIMPSMMSRSAMRLPRSER